MKRVIERSQEIRDQIMRSTDPDVRIEVATLATLVATLAAKVESLGPEDLRVREFPKPGTNK